MPKERHPDLRPGFKDAYNDRPSDLEPGDKLYYTVVASVGFVEDWAAYRGFGPPEQVMRYGDKLDEDTARKLFPICDHLEYRG